MTEKVDVHIRDGTESDCESILRLINGCAANHGLSKYVNITADDIKRDAFYTSPPLIYTVVAELTSAGAFTGEADSHPEICTNIIGHALFYKTYSTWNGKAIHLENLYVQPDYRLKGVGEKILKHIAKIAYTENLPRISWECTNWNESGLKFGEKYGATDVTIKDHWHSYRFSHETLEKIVLQ